MSNVFFAQFVFVLVAFSNDNDAVTLFSRYPTLFYRYEYQQGYR